MFSLDDFDKLQFLQGRWQGTSADGKPFFEEYERPEPGVLHSRRFDSAAFTGATEGATISFQEGEVLSRWNEFTWRAAEIHPDSATFTPVNAPGTFVWKVVDATTLDATQRWNADGREQEYTMRLTRVAA